MEKIKSFTKKEKVSLKKSLTKKKKSHGKIKGLTKKEKASLKKKKPLKEIKTLTEKQKSHGEIKSLTGKIKSLTTKQGKQVKAVVINKTIFTVLILCK